MLKQTFNILVVDDDDISLEILVKNIKDYGYNVDGCQDGTEAWERLSANPEKYDLVLLDKMMPQKSGMEVLTLMKQNEFLKDIPVIFQTGDVGVKEFTAGMVAGAYYYLCKPFAPDMMMAMVNAALRDSVTKNTMFRYMRQERAVANNIADARFLIKTHDEAIKISAVLACAASQPEKVKTVLVELMINAVEHGNLDIGQTEKNRLLSINKLEEEISIRSNLPENKDKNVEINFTNDGKNKTVIITDQGKGFNWKQYKNFDPMRLTEPNGRGIASAYLMDVEIEYIPPGNQVICKYT